MAAAPYRQHRQGSRLSQCDAAIPDLTSIARQVAKSGRCGDHPKFANFAIGDHKRAQISVLVGPFIPDGDPIFVEIANIRIARQKPQKFVDNRLHMEFFRGQHRKALRKVKPHLMAENGTCAGACPVAAFHAIINNALE